MHIDWIHHVQEKGGEEMLLLDWVTIFPLSILQLHI